LGEYTATATKEYIYLGDTPIAVVQADNILTVQTDHLDTPRQLTDNTKKVVWNWAYSAFGENQPTNINNTVFNLRYPGQYYDAESKLHYNINRYYDPATGRYTQSDPIGLAGGINTYTYVGGNTVEYTDKNGLQIQSPNIGDDFKSPPTLPSNKPGTVPEDSSRYYTCKKYENEWFDCKEKICKVVVDFACNNVGARGHCCHQEFNQCVSKNIDKPEKIPECQAKQQSCIFRGK
jgi:RHS repeat-associated protein